MRTVKRSIVGLHVSGMWVTLNIAIEDTNKTLEELAKESYEAVKELEGFTTLSISGTGKSCGLPETESRAQLINLKDFSVIRVMNEVIGE